MQAETTMRDRERQLEHVLREVLRVINSVAYAPPVAFSGLADGEQPNGEECFGPFGEVYDDVVVWPDLRWAKDQIVKALGS